VTDRAVIDQVDAVLVGSAKLPRDNGELVFEEPWQGRALGMGVVSMERFGITREEFRDALIAAIAAHPADPDETVATAYYAAWLDALEAVLGQRALLGA
jgi:nitrile hydratase accessory protein